MADLPTIPDDELRRAALPVSAARQDRSRETLRRIAVATAQLLEESRFEDLSVARIVSRARSSVGSFYARFRDKDALLDYLDELYARELQALLDGFVERAERPRPPLASLSDRLWSDLVAFHVRRKGLVRTLVLRARVRREAAFEERTRRLNARFVRVVDVFLDRRAEMTVADPKRAVPLGLAFAYSAMREHILFPESIRLPAAPSRRELVSALTRCLLGALGATSTAGHT